MIIANATFVFSRPLSPRTREGQPYLAVALWKNPSMVSDEFEVQACKEMTLLENDQVGSSSNEHFQLTVRQ